MSRGKENCFKVTNCVPKTKDPLSYYYIMRLRGHILIETDADRVIFSHCLYKNIYERRYDHDPGTRGFCESLRESNTPEAVQTLGAVRSESSCG